MATRTAAAQAVDTKMAELEAAIEDWLADGGSPRLMVTWLNRRIRKIAGITKTAMYANGRPLRSGGRLTLLVDADPGAHAED